MPLILEISSDNRIISLEDNVLTVRQQNEIAAEIPLREVRAVFVTAQNTLFGQNLLQNTGKSRSIRPIRSRPYLYTRWKQVSRSGWA